MLILMFFLFEVSNFFTRFQTEDQEGESESETDHDSVRTRDMSDLEYVSNEPPKEKKKVGIY